MRARVAGRYELLKPIGKGGMGEVFLALDHTTGAECALKRLATHKAAVPPSVMRREFEALTRVRHPAIIAVHELGFDFDGSPYYTMEYVPGLPADQALARGDWAALYFVAAEMTHGLQALHAAGVAHGDLKPSNLLVVPGAAAGSLPVAVRLLDFGLAALRETHADGHRGTPGFAAPELVRGEGAGIASDLYGLGSTLYALITGRPPFEGERLSSVLRRQQAGPPPARPLEEAGAPPGLARLVLHLLAPAALERPAGASDVRRELERQHVAARRPLAERMHAVVVAGRERELARLESRALTLQGRSRVVWLTGDPGIGKSALLGELAARAAIGGRRVALFSCAAAEGAGSTALRIARRLAADAGADVRAAGGLTPGTRAALSGEPAELNDEELTGLAEAAATWSRQAAARGRAPLVLLDAAEQIDPLSRAFSRRLILHPDAAPTLWVWARRTGASGPATDERMLLDAGLAETLALGPLDDDGLSRLAAARLGQPAPDALREHLAVRSGGHPGLAVELLRAAAEQGVLRESDAGLLVDAARLEAVRAAPSFEAALLSRLDLLPPAAQAVARALAAVERPLSEPLLRALAPAGDAAAIAAVVEAGLAARDDDGLVALAPPAIAGAILERLDPAARAALHRAVLAHIPLGDTERFAQLKAVGDAPAALESAAAAYAARPNERLAVEAASLAETSDSGEAAAWHERAAREMAAHGRYAAAIPHLERALALDAAAAARPGRWLLLSTAALRAGRPADVARVVRDALAETMPSAIRSLLLSNEAARAMTVGERESALRTAREALELAEAARDDTAIGIASQTLSGALLAGSESESEQNEAAAASVRAVEAFVRARDLKAEVRALGACATIAQARRRRAEAARTYREAISRARAHGLRLPLEELLLNAGVAMMEAGRWGDARAATAESVRLALEDERPRGAALAIANLAQFDGLVGEVSNARHHARGALRLCRTYLPSQVPFALRSLAQAARIEGRPRRAIRLAQRALTHSLRLSQPAEIEWCRFELARSLVTAGDWSGAGRLLDAALADAPSPGSTARALALGLAGRAALRRGEFEVAATRLEAAQGWLAQNDVPYAAALTEQLKAEIHLAQGRVVEGADAATRVLERLEEFPAPPDRAHAALEFARFALSGDSEVRAPAGTWLELAAGIFERLGDRRGRESALALMVEWLRRSGGRGHEAGRERNLLETVSQLLNSMSDFKELTRRAMRMAVEELAAERGVLLLADPENGRLGPVAECGAVDATTRRDAVGYSRRVVQRVAESGGSLLIGDAPTDPQARSESVVDLRLRSIVCVPLYLGGRVVGAVYLDDSRRPDVFSDADRALLEGFAKLMAVAIENSRGHEEVRRANELLVGENLSLRREVSSRFRTQNLIGTSSAMQRVLSVVDRAAHVNATVLLTGENGTGKELIARVLHHSGRRRLKPFVAINCGALPESLLETELFGILPHVATGVRARDGCFVQADGGTLFLDEVGEMPLKQQVALLSALANREITPVGGGKPIPVDVRIIAASNRDLRRLVQEGAFREDLFYRLSVIPIEVPPLRDRKPDIPALAQYFVALHARQQEREVPRLSREFIDALMRSEWPGNVRELQNYVERVLAMTTGETLQPVPLPRDLEERTGALNLPRGGSLGDLVEDLERRAIAEALEQAAGNQSLAARQLGMTEQSLRYRMRKYGLDTYRQKTRFRRNR